MIHNQGCHKILALSGNRSSRLNFWMKILVPMQFQALYAILFDFLDSMPSSDKTKGLKSIGYNDGYRDLGWCALPDDSVTQGSLCSAVNPTNRVRIPSQFYFFSILLKLEFYIFRNNDQTHTFPHFLTVGFVFLWAHNTSLQNSFTSLNFFKENQEPPRFHPVKLKILWQPQLYLDIYHGP